MHRYAHGGGDADIHVGSHDLWETTSPAFDVVQQMDYATDYYGAVAVGIINATGAAWRRHDAAVQAGVAATAPSPFFMCVRTNVTCPAGARVAAAVAALAKPLTRADTLAALTHCASGPAPPPCYRGGGEREHEHQCPARPRHSHLAFTVSLPSPHQPAACSDD
jgi:hypothetical protein